MRALLPAAIKVLPPADWAHINARMSDGRDPLCSTTVEQKFRALVDDRQKSPAAAKS